MVALLLWVAMQDLYPVMEGGRAHKFHPNWKDIGSWRFLRKSLFFFPGVPGRLTHALVDEYMVSITVTQWLDRKERKETQSWERLGRWGWIWDWLGWRAGGKYDGMMCVRHKRSHCSSALTPYSDVSPPWESNSTPWPWWPGLISDFLALLPSTSQFSDSCHCQGRIDHCWSCISDILPQNSLQVSARTLFLRNVCSLPSRQHGDLIPGRKTRAPAEGGRQWCGTQAILMQEHDLSGAINT